MLDLQSIGSDLMTSGTDTETDESEPISISFESSNRLYDEFKG